MPQLGFDTRKMTIRLATGEVLTCTARELIRSIRIYAIDMTYPELCELDRTISRHRLKKSELIQQQTHP